MKPNTETLKRDLRMFTSRLIESKRGALTSEEFQEWHRLFNACEKSIREDAFRDVMAILRQQGAEGVEARIREALVSSGVDMYAIDSFAYVHEVYPSGWSALTAGHTNVALVVPAVSGSVSPRYHAIRMDLKTKTISRIGCELDIYTARAVARRPMHRDGTPLNDAEMKVGRWTRVRWQRSQNTLEGQT